MLCFVVLFCVYSILELYRWSPAQSYFTGRRGFRLSLTVSRCFQKYDHLLSTLTRIFDRFDEFSTEPQPNTYSFEHAFYNPHLICNRTKLTPTGQRIATLPEVLQDFRRIFVLFTDVLSILPEFSRLDESDRVRWNT